MRTALTRPVGEAIARCELTHLSRHPIDLELARKQHESYETAIGEAGCEISRLPDAPDCPDAVFVEDVAVVLPELAIVTRPGAATRRGERVSIERALGGLRPRVARIEAPATLDGGDVLLRGRTLFVGRSTRSSAAALVQLRRIVEPWDYEVVEVRVHGCLHLKSAVTRLPDNRLLMQPRWLDVGPFADLPRIEVHPDEPSAANVLSIGERAIYSATHPRTANMLRAEGFTLAVVEISELEKAEGAVTCCSIVL